MDEEQNLGDLLSSNYLLASLNVRIWSGRKTDKAATQELLTSKGAVANAASVVKSLLAGNDAKLKETAAAFTRIRSFFYEHSSPWTTSSIGAMKGDRLVSTAASITFLGEFAKLKKDADTVLTEFLSEYDAAVQSASVSLGALYDVAQYPTKQQVATLFGAHMDLSPVPETADFDRLTNVPADLAKGLKDLYERNMTTQMNNALSDVQRRLLTELERMDTQLSKVAAGEKTRLFKSMTGNLKHLVGMARSLNIIGNKDINELTDTIEKHLLQYDVEMYKDNAALAKANAGIAKGIFDRASDDGIWRVDANDDETSIPSPLVESPQVLEVTNEGMPPAPVVQQEPENEQIEEDQEFLATLMNKIEEPDEDEEKSDVEEPEDAAPMSETPDFDPDDVMFNN
jgi:hypothetical protein